LSFDDKYTLFSLWKDTASVVDMLRGRLTEDEGAVGSESISALILGSTGGLAVLRFFDSQLVPLGGSLGRSSVTGT
jgi:hypothetical protein